MVVIYFTNRYYNPNPIHMKTNILRTGILTLIALFVTSALVMGQNRGSKKARPSPNAAVSQTIGTTMVDVTYGRPGLKGREIESLVPGGTVWRTGANESTVVTFSGDVKVAGKAVEAGSYSLYSIPREYEMTIIVNSKLSWGTQYDESHDVLRVNVPMSDNGAFLERFTIDFDELSDDKAHLNLKWGNYRVAVPIEG